MSDGTFLSAGVEPTVSRPDYVELTKQRWPIAHVRGTHPADVEPEETKIVLAVDLIVTAEPHPQGGTTLKLRIPKVSYGYDQIPKSLTTIAVAEPYDQIRALLLPAPPIPPPPADTGTTLVGEVVWTMFKGDRKSPHHKLMTDLIEDRLRKHNMDNVKVTWLTWVKGWGCYAGWSNGGKLLGWVDRDNVAHDPDSAPWLTDSGDPDAELVAFAEWTGPHGWTSSSKEVVSQFRKAQRVLRGENDEP